MMEILQKMPERMSLLRLTRHCGRSQCIRAVSGSSHYVSPRSINLTELSGLIRELPKAVIDCNVGLLTTS